MGKKKEHHQQQRQPWFLLFSVITTTAIFLSKVTPSTAATAPDDAAAMQSLAKSIKPLPSGWTTDSGADPCSIKDKWAGVSCDSGKVTFLSLRSQSLSGTLPPDLNKLSSLQSLALQSNALTGDLPSLENMVNLQEIYLNDNNFSSIPPTFFSGLTNLVNVSLDRNPFADWSIPDVLAQSQNLVSFTAMKAGVSGPIPEFFGKMASLQMLRLSYNNLVGEIPLSFMSSGIQELDLNNQNTKLSGRLDVLGFMTQLTTLMLQSNNFTGPIPDLSNCTSLSTLLLRDNRLTGVVPPSLSFLRSLGNLTLANNLLQGPFPDISPGVWKDSGETGNSFCNPKPGPCDSRVEQLLKVAEGLGYPVILANSWEGNDPCGKWLFVSCDPRGNITGLNFGGQRFGGTISPALADITSLKRVYLGNNNLTGPIPDSLTKMPQLQVLDVTNNNLTGGIPSFGPNVLFNFSGNPLLRKDLGVGSGGSSPGDSGGASPVSGGDGSTGKRSLSAVWIVLAIVATLVVAGVISTIMYRRSKRTPEFKKVGTQSPPNGKISLQALSVNGAGPSDLRSQGSSDRVNGHVIEGEAMFISIQALRQATDNFSEGNVLGRGGFGVVYRGERPAGTVIAVKRMECGEMGKKGMGEFQAEIGVLTKVRHRHLVALLGYCVEGNERLLVYEYMPQGTLGQHLFDGIEKGYPPLSWKQRLTIALDVARGLEYLHSLAQKSFIHRDLKPSNILLDNDMRAKVSDFGLVKLAPDGKYSVETRLAGTFGYLAPEYATTGRVTTKVDVYAFGVVLMELITGRKALDESLSEENTHLVTWFRRILVNKDNVRKALDSCLDLSEEDFRSATVVAELSGHCTAREANQRPDMGHAVNVLAPLVDLWKPSSSQDEDTFGMSSNGSLSQRLKRWQDGEGTSMMGFDFNSHVEGMENSQSSIPAQPNLFPHGR